MDDYYLKYLIYKSKYLTLKDSLQQNGGSSKYICNPNISFVDICQPSENGIYKSKEKCINDCEKKYINTHLIKAKLKHETTQFKLFIEQLMNNNFTVYIKGGTVLGLQILKMIYNKYSGKEFETFFNEFIKTGLIRDWDFVAYTNNKIDETFRERMDNLAKKFNLVPRAKTFILYQVKYPIRINDQALFEIALLEDADNNIDLELPLTTMKVKVNRRNLEHIFMLAKCFSSQEPIDIDIIKHIMKDMNIIIPHNKNGLFKFDKLYIGELSKDMLKLIKDYTKDIYLQQFLITHIKEPNRMLYRLLEKNIPKINKINTFFRESRIDSKKIEWLFDPIYINNFVTKFIDLIGSKIYSFIPKNKPNDITNIITNIDEFFQGINLFRLETEYKNFSCKGTDMIKVLFERIHNELFKDNIIEGFNESKLIKLLRFLSKQKIFNNN
jgi:hypothetical protein